MNWTQTLWLVVALISIVALVPLAFKALQHRPTRSTPAIRTAWLVGATTSGTMLVFIAAKVSDLIPNATAVDVGALAITGILTGFFLALGLKPTHTNEVKG
jgi:phosphoglycerol transferase MdoB-like AlkP superfamily enzyme